MTALRIFRTDKPSQIGATILPMSKEDARFWELRRARQQSVSKGNGASA